MKPYVPENLPLERLDWLPLIKLIGSANRELARYDGILQSIINPGVLLSPLVTQEAVLSSKIEGTQATLQEVIAFEDRTTGDPRKDADIWEIINYRSAMALAQNELAERPLSLNLIKKIHYTLLDSVRGRNKARGQFRREQNWIGSPGCTQAEATFVPPEHQHVIAHLAELEKYIHSDEQDWLVQLAIIHAQFELIHPFLDGNGRVGRILLPLFLYEKKLLSFPSFYLSGYLEANRRDYMDGLLNISRDGDWLGWIRFFLNAITQQAASDSRRAKAMLVLYNDMKIKIAQVTRSQFAIHTLDALFAKPIFSSTGFVSRSNIARASAMRILKLLREHQIITTLNEGSGRRAAWFVFSDLFDIVES